MKLSKLITELQTIEKQGYGDCDVECCSDTLLDSGLLEKVRAGQFMVHLYFHEIQSEAEYWANATFKKE
jgi:hypothetical protein